MKAGFVDKDFLKVGLMKILSPIWSNAIYSRVSPFKVEEIDEPVITHPRDVIVDNIYSGICGSDLTLLHADVDPRVSPAALSQYDRIYLGHENLARITAMGEEVEGFGIGDRVTVIQGQSCRILGVDLCHSCSIGQYFLCENVSMENDRHIDTGGGWANTWKYDYQQLLKIPDDISDEYAVLTEPFGICIHAVLRKRPQNDDTILIYGAGFIGLATLIITKYFAPKAEVYVIAKYGFQADTVEKYGGIPIMSQNYDTISQITSAKKYKGLLGNKILLGGFDIIYDCVGNNKTVHNSLRWARARGTVVLIGLHLHPSKLDLSPVWHQEVDFIGSNSRGTELIDGEEMISDEIAFEIFRSNVFDTKDLITHKFPLDLYQEAINTANNKSKNAAIKVIFDFT